MSGPKNVDLTRGPVNYEGWRLSLTFRYLIKDSSGWADGKYQPMSFTAEIRGLSITVSGNKYNGLKSITTLRSNQYYGRVWAPTILVGQINNAVLWMTLQSALQHVTKTSVMPLHNISICNGDMSDGHASSGLSGLYQPFRGTQAKQAEVKDEGQITQHLRQRLTSLVTHNAPSTAFLPNREKKTCLDACA
ncbi:hypothetical protein RRG08_013435 [Elysia crispata]|uniref:Uncharacterized protein n=1 Tax=Elysia crispata TaxID=231223 RepID=A0AAE1DJG3_9GAST|nr:hypothetical protein RRG08_013435 [Elysia crispata]